MSTSVLRIGTIVGLLTMAGCYSPYMNYGYPHGQQIYAPPQNLGQPAPGTLVIPESSAPPYDPGGASTYEDDIDDWRKSQDGTGSGSFFEEDQDDGLPPKPREFDGGGENLFNNDI